MSSAAPAVPRFSLIVPVLHEAECINALLAHLRHLPGRERSEIIVVDGSVQGETIRAIRDQEIITLTATAGRAAQMNAGAVLARGEILIFLHADTELPPDALPCIEALMQERRYVGGAFDLRIQSPRWVFRVISALASLRSRLTRIPYGDQACFIRRTYFMGIGGFQEIPLMEDIELMQRIKKTGGALGFISEPVRTSARRWQKEGILYCSMRNLVLSSLYYLGVSPHRLARFYPARGTDGKRKGS
jgi:rSAM/selenodomain-associated transferase 2